MKFGLTNAELNRIREVFRENPNAERVWIFGSRATGQNRPYSDIDLAVVGSDLTRGELLRLASSLDDLPLPFAFDLVHLDGLISETLREQIGRHGELLYERDEAPITQD